MARNQELSEELPVEQPQPEPQISVIEWCQGHMGVGVELITAFARGYGRDTATASDLERDLALFCLRPV